MTEIVFSGAIRVPVWIQDLDSFRRWTRAEDFPDQGEISYLGGLLWVDPSMERGIHNQIKTAVIAALFLLVRTNSLGLVYSDRMRLVHPEAGLSSEPDGLFLSHDALRRQRVQFEQGDESLEVVGSPDMVLEVVSPSSVEKDTVHLLDLYHKAGVQEYWLINPLEAVPDFKIYRYSARKYSAVRPQSGWLRSGLFQQSFRLVQAANELNLSEFTLEMR